MVLVVKFLLNSFILGSSMEYVNSRHVIYRLDLATRSSSSFFLMAYEFDDPFAALMSSSARHSAIVLMFLKAASRAPVQSNQMAWLTLLRGDTSTACLLTVPARPIRVESSRGPELMMALTNTWSGFSPVKRWMISKLCLTILTVRSFFPLFLPCIIRLLTRRSTIGHWALRNLLAAYLPAEWGRNLANLSLAAM